jgi:hypothetical protein
MMLSSIWILRFVHIGQQASCVDRKEARSQANFEYELSENSSLRRRGNFLALAYHTP